MEAHHRVHGLDTGRNSGGRWIKKTLNTNQCVTHHSLRDLVCPPPPGPLDFKMVDFGPVAVFAAFKAVSTQKFFDFTSFSPILSKRLRETADTVIVGGGVAGTSIAYQLAKQVKEHY